MRFIYITNTSHINTDPSVRYRCFNFASSIVNNPEHLVDVIPFNFLNLDYLKYYDVFIFHRPSFNSKFNTFMEKVKKLNKYIMADYDDLIFNPEYAKDTSIFKNNVSSLKQVSYILSSNKKAFDYFNNFIVSTGPLKEHIKQLKPNSRVLILHNSLSEFWNNLYPPSSRKDIFNKSKRVIGYFSGTNSHRFDFKIVEKSLENILKKNSNISLRIVGHLKIDNPFLREKVERVDFVPFYEMGSLIKSCDLAIAPLENSVFNNSKSCIKFLEALSVGVPCVASPIHDMCRNTEKGCLVVKDDNWEEFILQALFDKNLRINLINKFNYNREAFSASLEIKKLFHFLEKVYIKGIF